jgi:mannan endo-1,4-beta-mannosidase
MYLCSRLSLILFCLTPGVFVFSQNSKGLSDQHATAETKALYRNLGKLADQHILFGHQHATQYGHGWYGDENRSDVKTVTGSHPAVIGVDFSGFTGRPSAEVANEKKSVKKTIEDEYNRGGVITVAWHFNNPVSKTNFYWNDSTAAAAVPMIIPGGSHHADYKVILDSIAAFVKTLKGSDGKMVPLIFRPFHEFDGDWFWWGAGHCSIDEFKSLWRFTVTYMRDTLGVHNLIYAFSPDNRFMTEDKYLERYPGDGFVDLLGTDNYGDFGRDGHYDLDAGYQKLKIVSDYAQKTKKLAAFTETGLESIPDSTWWTNKLLPTLRRSNLRLCYVLVWRNDAQSKTHFYAPFPGQKSEKDFVKFYGDAYTLFETDLKNIYRK